MIDAFTSCGGLVATRVAGTAALITTTEVLHATGAEGSTPATMMKRRHHRRMELEMPAFQCFDPPMIDPMATTMAEYCGDIHGLVTSMPWAVGVPHAPVPSRNGGLAPLENDSDSVQPDHKRLAWRCSCGPADSLMLDAKQAILDETTPQVSGLVEGRSLDRKPCNNFHVTLNCASDVLAESIQLLERVLDARNRRGPLPARFF